MPNKKTVRLQTNTGRAIYFRFIRGSWVSPAGEFGTLTGTSKTGFVYTSKFGITFTFDTIANSGRILSITPANNTAITVSYNSGTMINSVTSGGRSLTFSYSEGRISKIEDPSGNVWVYDITDNLNAVTFSNTDDSGVHGQINYLYQDIVVNGVTFSTGGNKSQLTRITQRQTSEVAVDLGIFSYKQSKIVRTVSSAINEAFQNNVQLTYGQVIKKQSTTTITRTGRSTKTITVSTISGHPRITQIRATAEAGDEWTNAKLSWNTNRTIASITDGNGIVTTFSNYDSKGNPRTIVEGSGSSIARTIRVTYHPMLSAPMTISRLSVDGISQCTVTYDYDSDYGTDYNASPTNYPHQIIAAGKTDISLSGALESSVTHTSKIYYDSNHRITQVQGANGNSVWMDYWPVDTNYDYDNDNRLKSVWVNPSGDTTIRRQFNKYDENGRPLELQNPNNVLTNLFYNPLGYVLASEVYTPSDKLLSKYSYNLAGNLVSIATPEKTSINMDYDGASRIWRRYAKTADGDSVPWSKVVTFDNQNRVITFRRFAGLGSTTTPDGEEEFLSERTWDSFGQLASFQTIDSNDVDLPDDAYKVTFSYDDNGNLQSKTEAGLHTTSYTRDGLDRVTKITLPTGNYATFTYDISNHVITMRDPRDSENGGSGGNNRVTRDVYDDFGRLISRSTPDSGRLIQNFDASGFRTQRKDALGNVIQYYYDTANRLVKTNTPSKIDNLSYLYDETGKIGDSGITYANTAGRLTTVGAHDADGNPILSHYSYNELGYTVDNVEERGTLTSNFHYVWGENGELLSLTYPDEMIVNYEYPASGGYAPRPKPNGISVTYNGETFSLISDVKYFADGVISALTYGNGSTRELTRNRRGQMTHLVSGNVDNPVIDQQYEYDADRLGLLAAVHHFQGTERAWDWTYGYDELHRLTSYATDVRPELDSYKWMYDEVGNPLSQDYNGALTVFDYADDSKNQITSLSETENERRTYNENGFLVARTMPEEGIRYGFDSLNRLRNLYDIDTGQPLVSYDYNGAQDLWQRKSPDGTLKRFFYDNRGYVLQEESIIGTNDMTNNDMTNTEEEDNACVEGCINEQTKTVVDHIYIRGVEIARILFLCPPPPHNCEDKKDICDIHFVHEDFRRGPYGLESWECGGPGLESETNPFGQIETYMALPGKDGKIGTADDTAIRDEYGRLNNTGIGGSFLDDDLVLQGRHRDEWGIACASVNTALGPKPFSLLGFLRTPLTLAADAANKDVLARIVANQGSAGDSAQAQAGGYSTDRRARDTNFYDRTQAQAGGYSRDSESRKTEDKFYEAVKIGLEIAEHIIVEVVAGPIGTAIVIVLTPGTAERSVDPGNPTTDDSGMQSEPFYNSWRPPIVTEIMEIGYIIEDYSYKRDLRAIGFVKPGDLISHPVPGWEEYVETVRGASAGRPPEDPCMSPYALCQ